MTQEDKKILLKDLSARLLYGVKMYVKEDGKDTSFVLRISDLNWIFDEDRIDEMYEYDGWKPYLRPMSNMTEEEEIEYKHFIAFSGNPIGSADFIDWLNAHHFDYRGLIEKGLALEAPEGMYN